MVGKSGEDAANAAGNSDEWSDESFSGLSGASTGDSVEDVSDAMVGSGTGSGATTAGASPSSTV